MITDWDKVHSITGPTFKMVALLGLLSLTISVARVAVFRSDRKFVGQGYMYKEVALALASGQGYTETHGHWRGHPTMRRPPLWPFVLSLPMRVFPQFNPIAVTQFTTAIMHAATALGVALLVGMLSGSGRRMLLALLLTALLPEAQPLLLGGYCEPLAGAILVIGIFLTLRGDQLSFFSGVFVLSLLPLVRPNFLPLWAGVTAFTWWFRSRNESTPVFTNKRWLIAAFLLFYTPTAIWVLRNYLVSGAFPVVAGTASMTFYGNYNSLSATKGAGFGRWVSPEFVLKHEKTELPIMSEAEEFRYFDAKGKAFISGHWKIVPLLIGAHVVLSLLPSPGDGAHMYGFWLLRLLLYAATFIAIRQKTIRLHSRFGIMLTCTMLATAVTVVLYSGEGRYLYPLNVLFVVLVSSARYKNFAFLDKWRSGFRVANIAPVDAS